MKLAGYFIIGLLAVAAGCGKSDKTPPAPQMSGVTVDLPKLSEAFANAPEDVKSTVTQVGLHVRYKKYEDALMALDKLVNDPNTTEAQKKVVNQLIEEVKKLAGAEPPAL